MQCYTLQYIYIQYIYDIVYITSNAEHFYFSAAVLPLPTFAICWYITDGSHILLCIRYEIILAGRFNREGLHQLQSCVVADEDLRGRKVLLLTSFT